MSGSARAHRLHAAGATCCCLRNLLTARAPAQPTPSLCTPCHPPRSEKKAEAKRKGRKLGSDESDSDYDEPADGSGAWGWLAKGSCRLLPGRPCCHARRCCRCCRLVMPKLPPSRARVHSSLSRFTQPLHPPACPAGCRHPHPTARCPPPTRCLQALTRTCLRAWRTIPSSSRRTTPLTTPSSRQGPLCCAAACEVVRPPSPQQTVGVHNQPD